MNTKHHNQMPESQTVHEQDHNDNLHFSVCCLLKRNKNKREKNVSESNPTESNYAVLLCTVAKCDNGKSWKIRSSSSSLSSSTTRSKRIFCFNVYVNRSRENKSRTTLSVVFAVFFPLSSFGSYFFITNHRKNIAFCVMRIHSTDTFKLK